MVIEKLIKVIFWKTLKNQRLNLMSFVDKINSLEEAYRIVNRRATKSTNRYFFAENCPKENLSIYWRMHLQLFEKF